MPRLRRVDCSSPGLSRRRRGRGFEYLASDGTPITNEQELERIRALAIPPAWRDVWICSDPRGHLQATGIDAAGRKQYLYHDAWRVHRDRAKFERMVDFGTALPGLRKRVARDLRGDDLTRERVLAGAVRLLDLGFFRVGGEGYADENGSFGLATLRRRHVTVLDGQRISFDYPAKGGVRRAQSLVDPEVYELVRLLKRRRSGEELLAYRVGRRWVDVRSGDINAYLKDAIGEEYSAKDFRTWKATVLAAVALTVLGRRAASPAARKRVARLAVAEVARYLGNTPAVCRASYVDPRVFDRFDAGVTARVPLTTLGDGVDADALEAVEAAVLELLSADRAASATIAA
jgi:DNA topoisomerase IB